MKKLFQLAFFFIPFMALAHDQTIIPNELISLANPVPSYSDCHKKFKVLIAVIDSGVDYNHPILSKQIQYQYDSNCNPISFGYDSVGQDQWASPYLVRTDYLNSQISKDKREKDLKTLEQLKTYVEKLPFDIANKVNPHRFFPLNGISHGTSVAALASFDEPDIGIIGYRYDFSNKDFSKKDFSNNLVPLLDRAIKSGAKVINLSLGMYSTGVSMHEILLREKHKVADFIRKNPNTLFVAGMGNESKNLDFKDDIPHFPCGINLPNVLCVGSVNRDFEISSFSNTTTNTNNAIYALGEDIYSIFPMEACGDDKTINSRMDVLLAFPSYLNEWMEDLKKSCLDEVKLISGTSFSTPLVSRRAAQIIIENPKLTPPEVIKQLLREARTHNTQRHGEVKILLTPTPSWVKF